jgi:hypothetical protein
MTTLIQYGELESGMSYEEACGVLGEEGVLISSEAAQLEPGIKINEVLSEIFEWQGSEGGSARLLFKRNRLKDLSQDGLK